MVATTSANRVAPYLSEPKKTLPPLPATPEARQALLSDAVFAAVLALQAQLTHHDPAVVQKAAGMILDFEKTRLRHGRPVAGTAPPSPLEPLPPVAPLPPLDPVCGGDAPLRPNTRPELTPILPTAADVHYEFDSEFDAPPADPIYPELDEEAVGRVRAQLQQWADEHGTGEVVSRERAVWVAKQALDRQRQKRGASPSPPAGPGG